MLAILGMLVGGCSPSDPSSKETNGRVLSGGDQLVDGFTLPFSVVERHDGRVLVSDRAHRELWLVDFASGRRIPFGRSGDGPGEYRSVHEVLLLPGDSVAVIAHTVPYRISVLDPLGHPVRSTLLTNGYGVADDGTDIRELPSISSVDGVGKLYGVATAPAVSLQEDTSWSIAKGKRRPIVRLTLNEVRFDTVAFDWEGQAIEPRRVSRDPAHWQLGFSAFAAQNAWTVTTDGTIILVDATRYSITKYAPDGQRTTVTVPTLTRFRVSPEAFDRSLDSAEAQVVRSMGAAMAISSARAAGRPEFRFERPEAPEVLPPVLASVLRRVHSAGDQLWIPVAGPASPVREYWDVIDSTGVRVATFTLPKQTSLRSVSERYVYTARTDNDGLQWVSRIENPVQAHR